MSTIWGAYHLQGFRGTFSEVPTRFEDSRIFEITVRIGGFAALDICHANTHANLLNFQKTACNLITSGQIDREAQ